MRVGTFVKRVAFIVALVFAAACAAPQAAPEATSAPAAEAPAVKPTSTGALAISVPVATYGSLEVRTMPGSKCTAELKLKAVLAGERPPLALPEQVADGAGVVKWTYPTPRMSPRAAAAEIACTTGALAGSASARFDVPVRPVLASRLTVRVTSDEPPGAPIFRDAALVPLREKAVVAMRASLAEDWRIATRALGSLRIVEDSADITIFVAAAQGTSLHRLASDSSEDVVIYVSEPVYGASTVENLNAVALHELGHIWCCFGDGTFARGTKEYGHWSTKERDPRLYGIDKYGLMTDPVTCGTFGAILSCPNRFSDREMVQLGFATFPPPIPDPCIQQALPLKSQVDSAKAQLDKLSSDIDGAKATLASLNAQIKDIEARYPNGAPASVVDTYRSLIAQYNALGTTANQWTNQYNDLLAKARALAGQLNALPCDPS